MPRNPIDPDKAQPHLDPRQADDTAQARAKEKNLDKSGLRSRVKGHASSRDRKAEAKRDSRNDA